MSVNKVILVGNLGRDPEVRHLPTGMKVANFSLATTMKRKTGEQTEWHNIVAFDRLADLAEKYLRKGKQIYLEGRLQTRQWEAKDGSGKRQRTEIIMNEMQFIGSARDNGGGGDYAVAAGGLARTPLRLSGVESMLATDGGGATLEALNAAITKSPIASLGDPYGSLAYKTHIGAFLLSQILKQMHNGASHVGR